MGIKTTGLIFFFMMITCGCSTPLNELPMYGGIERPQALIEADARLIETVTKNQTRKEASREAAMLGWHYFRKNDLSTAMKRFNQAWLLDPDNPVAYWGFGAVLGRQSEKGDSFQKIDQSIEMLDKAVKLSPQNARLLTDLAYSYTTKGLLQKTRSDKTGQESFDRAATLYKQAREMGPEFGLLYYNWAINFYYQEKYEETLSMLEEAKKLSFAVPQDFIEELKGESR